MFKVAVIGGDNLVVRMFEETEDAEVTVLNNPINEAERAAKYDLVVFTGGSDVTPWLYGERNTMSHNNLNRDIREMLWYHRFINTNKVGICRGGQFLFTMNGGVMDQHIEGHGESHKLSYQVWDPGYKTNSVTSTHHQHMAKPAGGMSILATAKHDGVNEVVWCGNTKSLCFQPHPEYGDEACRELFFWYLTKLFKMDFMKAKRKKELAALDDVVEVMAPPARAMFVADDEEGNN